MFIHNLNFDQQSALLYLAHEVAKADGTLHSMQVELVEVLKTQSQQGVEERAVEQSELASIFDTERSKCSAVLELLGVAHANQEYHANEKDLIGQYAHAMGLSSDKLFALEAWVEKELALMQEVEQLLD